MNAYTQIGTGRQMFPWGGVQAAAPSSTTFLLDSLYDPNNASPAGDAIGLRLRLVAAKTLTTVYFYITAESTPSPDTLDAEIRIGGIGSADPGAGNQIATATSGAITAASWNSVALSGAVAAAAYRYICIGNKSWVSGSHTILKNWASAYTWNSLGQWEDRRDFSTTGGWASGWASANTSSMPVVVVFDDGTIIGFAFGVSTNALFTNNTLYRGLKIDGITESIKLLGFMADNGVNWPTSSLFEGSALPNAPTQTATGLDGTSAQPYVFIFDNRPVTLAKSTVYRFAMKPSANSQRPSAVQIGTGADATLRAAMPGGNTWVGTQEIAGPAWSDTADALPTVMALVESQVAVTGGAGGGPLVGGRLVG